MNDLYKTEVIEYLKADWQGLADVQLATLNWVIENKRIPIPEHVQPEPEKRGFGSRFLDPMINHDCLTNMNKVVKHWSKNRRGT
ncbi:hypothetical protein BFR62_13335 [Acinetobacter pittii]|nr:hypothetical protein BFR62_13335 [Acinetobacter pittii]